MGKRRLLAAIGAPLFVVACATGSAPLSGAGDSGASGGDSDASYGADDAGAGYDGGVTNKEGGATTIDSGAGGSDSGGGGGGGGGDCTGSKDGIGIKYDDICEVSGGGDGTCTPGGTDCPSGDCCFSDNTSQCYADFGPSCVPQ